MQSSKVKIAMVEICYIKYTFTVNNWNKVKWIGGQKMVKRSRTLQLKFSIFTLWWVIFYIVMGPWLKCKTNDLNVCIFMKKWPFSVKMTLTFLWPLNKLIFIYFWCMTCSNVQLIHQSHLDSKKYYFGHVSAHNAWLLWKKNDKFQWKWPWPLTFYKLKLINFWCMTCSNVQLIYESH